jgi:hypothetical protein
VRAVAFIALLAFSLAVGLTGPHVHSAADGHGSVCATCELRSNPVELTDVTQLPIPVAVAVDAAPVVVSAPRAVRCLEWAPKQGPPAA